MYFITKTQYERENYAIFYIFRLKRSCVSVYHQKFREKDKEINCKTITKKRHLEIWISILNVPIAVSDGDPCLPTDARSVKDPPKYYMTGHNLKLKQIRIF